MDCKNKLLFRFVNFFIGKGVKYNRNNSNFTKFFKDENFTSYKDKGG